MSMKMNFKEHGSVIKVVAEAQGAETDQRKAVRESKLFIYKRDGQWDPYALETLKLHGRFRGTFDMCTPIVDQISGEIDQSDFTLKISPVSGGASADTAKTLNGLVRNILNISNADHVFSTASRSNVIGGFDCFEVVQDWVDGDSFDQDLFIKRVPNAVDSVWFDLASTLQDRSDAQWAVKMTALPKAKYDKMWPKASGQSVSQNVTNTAYWNAADVIIVGKIYYRKRREIEIVRMTDGSVYEDNEDFKKVKDELALQNITIELDNDGEEKRRTRASWRVFTRMFDGSDWLSPEEETVFDYIPLVPIYGNFEIIENKPIYFGKIEKLYDEQRGLNYAMSRDIDDGSLSPKPSVWMTEKQAEGNDYSTMNTDAAPVRIYNPDPEAPPPMFTQGPTASSGLQTTIANMQQMISASSNTFSAGQGNALASQSGIAGQQQIEQGNIGSIKWFEALKVAVCHIGRVMVNGAIPRTYDSTRQVRILDEDGTSSMVALNDTVFDQQTQTNVELNNLSIGQYDAVCDFGPAFNSQQKETAQSFLDMSAVVPGMAEMASDVWVKNLGTPGMDLVAERLRVTQMASGNIPESQWTDEERQQIAEQQAQQQNQPPQEDPNMVIARAEELKGQAAMTSAQGKQAEIQGNQQLEGQRLQLEGQKLQLDTQKFLKSQEDKFNVAAANIDQGQQKIDQSQQQMLINAQQAQEKIDRDNQAQQFDQEIKAQQLQITSLTEAINQMKGIKEASGADAIIGPGIVDNFKTQSDIVSDEQDEV